MSQPDRILYYKAQHSLLFMKQFEALTTNNNMYKKRIKDKIKSLCSEEDPTHDKLSGPLAGCQSVRLHHNDRMVFKVYPEKGAILFICVGTHEIYEMIVPKIPKILEDYENGIFQ
jgi:Txe/YoeB family toxin of Txe-Axe toxin-antitoxin module